MDRWSCPCRQTSEARHAHLRLRLPGLWWLGGKVFPALFPEDLSVITREFYKLFYQVDLNAEQVQRVLAGRD